MLYKQDWISFKIANLHSEMSGPLHTVTPLIASPALSQLVGRDVLLKLENLQPGGSFKIRGIGHTMQAAVREGLSQTIISLYIMETFDSHEKF